LKISEESRFLLAIFPQQLTRHNINPDLMNYNAHFAVKMAEVQVSRR